MQLAALPPAGPRQLVQRYGAGRFTVSGVAFTGPILVFPDHTIAWHKAAIASLTEADMAPVLAAMPKPELLLVGCGARAWIVPPAIRALLKAAGIGIEAMDTGAAIRTHAVLSGEDRRLVAALVPVG